MRRYPAFAERLWNNIDRRGPNERWPWTARAWRGYGLITRNNKNVRAHRAVYELSRNVILVTAIVRHTCDNPLCCNPRHLLSGIHQDNMDDRMARNRTARFPGSRNGRAILNASQVAAIRLDPRANQVIAAEYGVERSTIWKLKEGRTWRQTK